MFVYVVNKAKILRWALLGAAIVAAVVLLVVFFSGSRGADSQQTTLQSGRQLPVYRVAIEDKKVALTFDAAWGEQHVTPILDELDRFNIKCTFFIVGFWADQYPQTVREIAQRGHEVACHSTNHLHMASLTREQMQADLTANCQKLHSLTGREPMLFRPPFGEYNDTLIRVAAEEGMTAVQWSLDAYDWDGKTADDIEKRIKKSIKPGDIVLMQTNNVSVVGALNRLIADLQAEGYQFVTVSEMLKTGETYVDKTGTQRARA